MALSYEPLWNFLNKLHISKMDFAKRVDISNATLAKLGKNEPVTLTVIEKICNEFHCNIKDIVVHVSEDRAIIPIDLLKPGVIVECQCHVLNTPMMSRIEKIHRAASLPQYCVILTEYPQKYLDISTPRFLIAPILLDIDPECIFDVTFTNAHIDNESKDGYIQLSKLSSIPAKQINKIIGKIPRDKIDSINRGILLDMLRIMIKHNIITETLLYNIGFNIDSLKI